jgi:HlyD family secretion protein
MNPSASRIRRIVWGIIAAALVVATAVVALRPTPVLVDTASVTRGPMQVTIDEDGLTRIRERYVVSAPLSGRLLRITWDVGDTVRGNQTVLARMEPTDPELLDPRAFAQAEARVRAAERKLEAAKAEWAKANAELNFAESEMGRVRQLVAKNAASTLELEEKKLDFRRETEETRAAGFAVEMAQYELELQRAALILADPSAEKSDGVLEIKSPIDGRILRIYQESTAVVQPGAALLELGDPTDLEIVADFLSRDAVRIKPGDPVALEHWGGGRPLKGTVRLVEPSGFTKVSALGVEEQRVNVIMDLLDPPEDRVQLGDSFRVDCRVIVWQADSVLQIPFGALFRVDQAWHVFVVEDGIARRRPVEVGHTNERQAEILGGLTAGDEVIIHPGDAVDDGVLVQRR